MKLIVGMTGVTGAVLDVRLLQQLRSRPEVETHLFLSPWARAADVTLKEHRMFVLAHGRPR